MLGPITAPPISKPNKPGNRSFSAISGPNTTINPTTVNPNAGPAAPQSTTSGQPRRRPPRWARPRVGVAGGRVASDSAAATPARRYRCPDDRCLGDGCRPGSDCFGDDRCFGDGCSPGSDCFGDDRCFGDGCSPGGDCLGDDGGLGDRMADHASSSSTCCSHWHLRLLHQWCRYQPRSRQ